MNPILYLSLILAVFMTALHIVVTQNDARKVFVEIQALEKQRDQLNEEWGRLQLEQSTWATDGRIEEIARTQLQMKNPEISKTMVVTR